MNLRKQYHFQKSENGFYAWDVDKLIPLSKELPVFEIEIEKLGDFYEPFWYQHDDVPSCHSIVGHMKLIAEVSLEYPIILSAENKVMDGMHRIGKAYLEGHQKIKAVRFRQTPQPDFTDVYPDELDYD